MKVFVNPGRETWEELCKRPQLEFDFLESTVRNILDRVKKGGDVALRGLTQQFDKVYLDTVVVSEAEIEEAVQKTTDDLKDAIRIAASNIRKFHEGQRRNEIKVETMPGVICWSRSVGIDSIGIYIPGGSAPLFSTVLMLGIPATLAGCKEIVLCTPPNENGKVSPAILYAASIIGITRIFKIGGAQAIAAMAYGTESVPKVYKIFGPGNQFVTKAKQIISLEGTAIDFPAGPSEVLVVADEDSIPAFVASDLIAQAEHGEDSQVMLIVKSSSLIKSIQSEIDNQLPSLPRREIAIQSLENSKIIFLNKEMDIIDFVNEYAPEHLIINTGDAVSIANAIRNAGSVFIGNYSAEAIGDYASGTNHTLPTNGFAKVFSGVSLESFMRNISFQEITQEGLKNIAPVVERMAEAEGLEGHKRSVSIRYKKQQL